MNKHEFLRELEALLTGISPDERAAAMQYYTEYLDEAGPEREEAVLAELGSPEKVAQDVRAASGEDGEGWTPPTQSSAAAEGPVLELYDSDTVSRQAAAQAEAAAALADAEAAAADTAPPLTADEWQPGPPPMSETPPAGAYPPPPAYTPRQNSSAGKIILIILLCIFFSPVIAGLLGVAAGLLACLLVLMLVPFIVGVSFVAAAVASFAFGVMFLPVSAGSGVFSIGTSVLLLGLGVLLCYFGGWLLRKIIPAIFHGIAALFRKIFHKQENQYG